MSYMSYMSYIAIVIIWLKGKHHKSCVSNTATDFHVSTGISLENLNSLRTQTAWALEAGWEGSSPSSLVRNIN